MSWPIMLFVTDYRIANSNQKLKYLKDVILENESSNMRNSIGVTFVMIIMF